MKKRYSRNRSKIFSLGVTRPFVNKRNRLMLGSGRRSKIRKQKGGVFCTTSNSSCTNCSRINFKNNQIK